MMAKCVQWRRQRSFATTSWELQMSVVQVSLERWLGHCMTLWYLLSLLGLPLLGMRMREAETLFASIFSSLGYNWQLAIVIFSRCGWWLVRSSFAAYPLCFYDCFLSSWGSPASPYLSSSDDRWLMPIMLSWTHETTDGRRWIFEMPMQLGLC